MKISEVLYAHCLRHVQERIKRIRGDISQFQASANEETKSSAGDKYETGRAMAQQEVERSSFQLREAEKLLTTLKNIAKVRTTNMVTPGSLVATSRGVFYIAISLGLVIHEQKQYFIISGDSPIGKLMMGKHAGDTIAWNNQAHIIQAIE